MNRLSIFMLRFTRRAWMLFGEIHKVLPDNEMRLPLQSHIIWFSLFCRVLRLQIKKINRRYHEQTVTVTCHGFTVRWKCVG